MSDALARMILGGIAGNHERDDDHFGKAPTPEQANAIAESLTSLAGRYLKKHEFKPLQLVQWKRGLKNMRFPHYGEPVIVIEIKPGLVSSSENDGNPMFKQPLDLAVGKVMPDGEFCIYHMDSARFEPYVAASNDLTLNG